MKKLPFSTTFSVRQRVLLNQFADMLQESGEGDADLIDGVIRTLEELESLAASGEPVIVEMVEA